MLITENQLPCNVRISSMFYKNKNIRIYRHLKDESTWLAYWYSVLILDEQKADGIFTGRLLVGLDIRSLPGYNAETTSGYHLIKSPEKIVPKLVRDAMKENLFTESMFIAWNESKDEFGIEEI